MELDQETTAVLLAAALVVKKRRKCRKKTTRSVSVKPWLSRRINLCVYDSLLQELRSEDEAEYRKFLRMAPENFDELLEIPSTLL